MLDFAFCKNLPSDFWFCDVVFRCWENGSWNPELCTNITRNIVEYPESKIIFFSFFKNCDYSYLYLSECVTLVQKISKMTKICPCSGCKNLICRLKAPSLVLVQVRDHMQRRAGPAGLYICTAAVHIRTSTCPSGVSPPPPSPPPPGPGGPPKMTPKFMARFTAPHHVVAFSVGCRDRPVINCARCPSNLRRPAAASYHRKNPWNIVFSVNEHIQSSRPDHTLVARLGNPGGPV